MTPGEIVTGALPYAIMELVSGPRDPTWATGINELAAMLEDQLRLTPAERLSSMGWQHPQLWREALELVGQIAPSAVLVGPVAATLYGSPMQLGESSVDVLVSLSEEIALFGHLFEHAGAEPLGVWEAADARTRQAWKLPGGVELTFAADEPWAAELGPLEVQPVDLEGGLTAQPLRLEQLGDYLRRSRWPRDGSPRAAINELQLHPHLVELAGGGARAVGL